jgi:hypothetical protein
MLDIYFYRTYNMYFLSLWYYFLDRQTGTKAEYRQNYTKQKGFL